MLKSYPGWVPYSQTTRSMKPKRPADEIDLLGIPLSRHRLAATIRSVVITAVPLILYFSGVTWAVSLLAPFAPIMGLQVGGMFSTTGGVMFLGYSFLASLVMLIPSLAALIPMAAGHPWIGAAVAVTVSWVAVFVWTYIDPTKRSIGVVRIFNIFLLMLGMAITTEKAGWSMFRSTCIFLSLLTAAGLGIMWFSYPLCLWMTREFEVGLYNLGILLDASSQPIQAHAMNESLPHFHLDHPLPSVSKLRANHQKQIESMSILMRENMFESMYAPVEADRTTKLLQSFILLSDCIVSAAACSLRGLSNILVAEEWSHLNVAIDEFVATTRSIFDECIRCLYAMYSGHQYQPQLTDLMKQQDASVEQIMKLYTHSVKKDQPSLDNRDNSATVSLDHWIFQLSQLNKATHAFVKVLQSATEQCSSQGWGWLIGYHIRAFIMSFMLLFMNTAYLLRCLLVMVTLPFRALGRCCCGRRENAPDIELGPASPAPAAAAPAQPPAQPSFLMKLVKGTDPPKIYMADYIREGRYKFLIRYVVFATAIAAVSLSIHLYWIPKVNTPFWMITSCLIVMSPTVGSTWRRTMQRACGTFIGAVLGQIVVIVCISTHKYVAFGPLILATIIAAYMQNSEKGRYNYFWNISLLTFGIVVITDYPFVSGASWRLGSYRFLFVFCGAILGTLSALLLPEYSYDRYLDISRQVLSGSHKAIKLIHHGLSQNTPVEVPKLLTILGGLHMLQGAAVAIRDDAEAEVMHRPKISQSIRFIRYKLRDVLFMTRLQILSSSTGFGSSVNTIASSFIKKAEKVIQNIDLEVEYVDTRLKKHSALAIMPLSTDEVRSDFQALESNIAELLKSTSPDMTVQINSHLTLFRVFCVCVHDLARACDHYYGT